MNRWSTAKDKSTQAEITPLARNPVRCESISLSSGDQTEENQAGSRQTEGQTEGQPEVQTEGETEGETGNTVRSETGRSGTGRIGKRSQESHWNSGIELNPLWQQAHEEPSPESWDWCRWMEHRCDNCQQLTGVTIQNTRKARPMWCLEYRQTKNP